MLYLTEASHGGSKVTQITLFWRFLEDGDRNQKTERWNSYSKHETHFGSKIGQFGDYNIFKNLGLIFGGI